MILKGLNIIMGGLFIEDETSKKFSPGERERKLLRKTFSSGERGKEAAKENLSAG
jgi:hypothetical protein